MNRLIIIISIIICNSAYYRISAQSDTTINLDLLQAPSSPGSSLLGFSPSEIEKPSDPSAFMISIQNASDNLSKLPNSYAVDIAPAWMFCGNKIKFEQFRSNKLKDNIKQSFVISTAIKNINGTVSSYTQFGLGLKVSIFRGSVDKSIDDIIRSDLQILLRKSNELALNLDSLQRNDEIYNNYKSLMRQLAESGQINTPEYKALQILAQERSAVLKDKAFQVSKDEYKLLKSNAEKLKFKRYGWKLDLAGGTAWNFPNQVFSYGKIMKGGVWLTGGYEYKKGLSWLGIIRYLLNPDSAFADPGGIIKNSDIHTLDMGSRLIFYRIDSKFLFSGEILYRSILNTDEVEPSWRFTINSEYDIAKNMKLTLVLGRDFDGTVTKKGNVIAALNFIKAFGTNKQL